MKTPYLPNAREAEVMHDAATAAGRATNPNEALRFRLSGYFLAMQSRRFLPPEVVADVRAVAPRLAVLIRQAGGKVAYGGLVYSVAPDGSLVCSLPLGDDR